MGIVSVIARFLCDRLEDETGLKDTAQGLVALQKAQRFGKDEASLIASAYEPPEQPDSWLILLYQADVSKTMQRRLAETPTGNPVRCSGSSGPVNGQSARWYF
jgi:hypothetical protein